MSSACARVLVSRWLLSGLAVLACSSCDSNSSPEPASELPEPEVARRAVETALRSWQDNPQLERTTTKIRPIMFVEQQQPPEQRLSRFDILGETPGYEDEGYRRFLVRLTLAVPDDSVVATYYVFGRNPVWVYRAEDFEMIMHMDKSMLPTTPGPVVEPEPILGKNAESESRAGSSASVLDGPTQEDLQKRAHDGVDRGPRDPDTGPELNSGSPTDPEPDPSIHPHRAGRWESLPTRELVAAKRTSAREILTYSG